MSDIVDDYLRELESIAGARLSEVRRHELVADIREHILAAVSAGEAPLAIVERLGTPLEIVDAETPEEPAVSASPTGPRLRNEEVAALILLQVGAFCVLVGWFLGVVLLWTSNRWTTRDKLIGTLLVPGGISASLMFGAAYANGINNWVLLVAVIILVVMSIGSTIHLKRSATIPY